MRNLLKGNKIFSKSNFDDCEEFNEDYYRKNVIEEDGGYRKQVKKQKMKLNLKRNKHIINE